MRNGRHFCVTTAGVILITGKPENNADIVQTEPITDIAETAISWGTAVLAIYLPHS